MNIIVLSVVVIATLASLGVAAYTLYAMATVSDELRDFVGFGGMHIDD